MNYSSLLLQIENQLLSLNKKGLKYINIEAMPDFELKSMIDGLDKMISIKEYSIKSFQQNEISFSLIIFGTEDQFKKSVQTHKDFSIERTATGLIHASLNSI